MTTSNAITISIKNTQPIELLDLTESLSSLAFEFESDLQIQDPEKAATGLKLYVEKVASGSIEASLVAMAPYALQFAEHASAVVHFVEHLKAVIEFLSGKSEKKPELAKQNYENISRIVEPICKDRGSQMNIGIINGNLHVHMDSRDANAIQNSARRAIQGMREPVTGVHEKVVLRWYQTRSDLKSKAGDRAIIESISPTPVRAEFMEMTDKKLLLSSEGNPFQGGFLVDVSVETINGKPALYKVLSIHEHIDLED